MPVAEQVKAKLEKLPSTPGCYLFRDGGGRLIYVGKARDLRDRVLSYFRESTWETTTPLRRRLIEQAEDLEWIPTRTEAEALLLESRLIKAFKPRFNIAQRDDKRFLLVRIHLGHPFPRFEIGRLRKGEGWTTFGPYLSSSAARAAVDFVERRFGIRKCRPVRPTDRDYQHCHADIIRNCSAPCIGRVTPVEYRHRVDEACAFLSGQRPELVEEVRQEMEQAADVGDFERAATLRDTWQRLETAVRQARLITGDPARRRQQADVGLEQIRQWFGLAHPPQRIECMDISTISGTHSVASLVCARDGIPAPRWYRRYRIRTVSGVDDSAMIKEVVRRHAEDIREGERPAPDLLLVDGGPMQLRAAMEAFQEAGLTGITVAALAKRREEIYRAGDGLHPLSLDRDSPGVLVLRRLRDEAHRFALAYHQRLRNRRVRESLLDDIPGVGPKRKRQLLRRFGSVRGVQRAALEELAAVPGIGWAMARVIHEWLSGSEESADQTTAGPISSS